MLRTFSVVFLLITSAYTSSAFAFAAPTCGELRAAQVGKQAGVVAQTLSRQCAGAKANHVPALARELYGAYAKATSTAKAFGGSDLNLVTGDETYPMVTQAGSASASNGDTIVTVYTDSSGAPDSFSGMSVSTDGGQNFTRLSPNPFGEVFMADVGSPHIAYDATAEQWLAVVLTPDCAADMGNGIGLMTTATGMDAAPEDPTNWSLDGCVHTGDADDRPMLWVNASGRRYVSWNDFSPNGDPSLSGFDATGASLKVAYSDGAGWTEVTVDDGALAFKRNAHLTGNATTGTAFIFAVDEAGGGGANMNQMVFRSTDGGDTWTSIPLIGNVKPAGAGLCSGSDYFYMVPPVWRTMGWGVGAAGQVEGTNYVHYIYDAAGRTPRDLGDIYYLRSTDDGLTWNTPTILNSDEELNSNVVQWQPSIVMTEQGYVLASWYDRRNSVNGTDYQYFGYLSVDNGASFVADLDNSDEPIASIPIEQPLQRDPALDFCFAGNSNFHSVASNDALVTWTDGRNLIENPNRLDEEMMPIEESQMDVFFRRVPLCPDIDVSVAPALSVGQANVAYPTTTFAAAGGTAPYTFSLSGTLADGLVLDEMTGEVTGTPTGNGISDFAIVATDALGCEGSADYSLIVEPDPGVQMCDAITLDPLTAPDGAQGAEFDLTVTAADGAEPYTFAVTDGALPLGVTLNTETGEITGIPQESGGFDFTVTATDSLGCTGTQAYTSSVACPTITLSPARNLPDGYSGFPYTANVTANGGTPPYRFRVEGGTQPAGMYIGEGGSIFGMLESGGTKQPEIQAIDANGCLSESKKFRLDSNKQPGLPGTLRTLVPDPLNPGSEVEEEVRYPRIRIGMEEDDFMAEDICGGTESGWAETQACPSSSDVGHTPGAHARWGLVDMEGAADCASNSFGSTAAQGALHSPEYDISQCTEGAVRLSFNYLLGFDEGPNVNRARVEAVADGGEATVIADNGVYDMGMPGPTCSGLGNIGIGNLNNASGWQHASMEVEASSTFQFSFIGETDDDMNPGEGFLIDDVTLQCTCPDLMIEPEVLTPAQVDQGYVETLTVEGGAEPYSFGTLPGSNPPPGLNLDAESGVISGVPTTPGVFTFVTEVFDDNACRGERIYNLIVGPASCPDITFEPASLETATQGEFYATTVTATGGMDPLVYSVTSGEFPPGVSLNPDTGVISGIPTRSGVFEFTLTVLDAQNCSSSIDYAITVNAESCPVIDLTPEVLANARAGTSFIEQLTASGGLAPYTWAVTSGTLPAGISLDTMSGELAGIPTSGGLFTFGVAATDAGREDPESETGDLLRCTGGREYNLTVTGCPAISVTPATLPNLTPGTGFMETITSSGGEGMSTFSVVNGALPDGITLDPMTGAFSGTASAEGTFTFTIQAQDELGCTGVESYEVTVGQTACPVLDLAPEAISTNAFVGTSFSAPFIATGGTGPYAYSTTAGTLPDGLALDPPLGATSSLTGTPTTAGFYSFDITAVDTVNETGGMCDVTQSYNFAVSSSIDCPTISLSPQTLPGATATVGYSETITAAGGTPGYEFYYLSGDIPAGLTLGLDGTLSGTPTMGGVYDFRVAAFDGNQCVGKQTHTLSVTSSQIEVVFKDGFESPTP